MLLSCLIISGAYRVGIKFNDQHIPDSPYKVYMTPGMADANKVMLGSMPENNMHVNKPIGFIMHMNGAKGMPDGKVIGPDGQEDDCFISPVDEGTFQTSVSVLYLFIVCCFDDVFLQRFQINIL